MENSIEEKQIISINFGDFEYESLLDLGGYIAMYKEHLLPGKMIYLICMQISSKSGPIWEVSMTQLS